MALSDSVFHGDQAVPYMDLIYIYMEQCFPNHSSTIEEHEIVSGACTTNDQVSTKWSKIIQHHGKLFGDCAEIPPRISAK